MDSRQTTLLDEALRPGDAGYDAASQAYFATGHPAIVVRPRTADDVTAALNLASAQDLAVSVRAGGHSVAGHSTNDGGILIDLTDLDDVEVLDAKRRLVRVGGGATWGHVASSLASHGWGITAGDTAGVGVGGLTLGGGIGWMVRRYGLAIDNLVGARVVTADGRLLTTSHTEHADLFWALRGGGGNFGVVVDFDFLAQPIETVQFGTLVFEFDDPANLIAGWRDAMRGAREELSSTIALTPRMPGADPSVVVLVCYAGAPGADQAGAEVAMRPLLELGTTTAVNISVRQYSEILEHAVHPPGLRLASRNTLVSTLDDATIAQVVRAHEKSSPAAFAIRSLGGAVSRVSAGATAFAHRDAEAMIVALLMLPGGATDVEVERALTPWRAVAERGIGTYLNFQGSTTAADLAAAYPPATYARLARIKSIYDPRNRFAHNHNIEPADRDK